jgi:hypothetical protein
MGTDFSCHYQSNLTLSAADLMFINDCTTILESFQRSGFGFELRLTRGVGRLDTGLRGYGREMKVDEGGQVIDLSLQKRDTIFP